MAHKSGNNYRRYPSGNPNSFSRPIHHINQFPQTEKEHNTEQKVNPSQDIGDNKWSRTDKIAVYGVLVSAVLAIVTYLLYTLSISAAGSARISADAAKQSADLQKQALDSQKVYKKQSDISDAAKVKRDTDAFNLQIASLNETQKDFEIESRPFVTVGNVVVDTPYLNKSIKGTAQIVNSGKQPAYIISAYYDWRLEPDTSYTSMKNIKHQTSVEQGVIVGGGGSIPFWTNTAIIDSVRMEYYKTHPLYCYVRATITYRGFSKKKVYKTSLMFRIMLKTDKDSKTVFYKAS
jgi:hypothetical protein